MLNKSVFLILVSSITLSACAKSTENRPKPELNTPEIQKEVQLLLDRTKKNLIKVEGGSYLMGDFGLVNHELEKTVPDSMAVVNPKGNVEKPPYQGKVGYSTYSDNRPLHKVILDTFYMTNNKISLQDYLIYLKVNSLPEPHYLNRYPDNIFHKLPAGANWFNAQKYCQWLGKKMGTEMDLPTEAQWEYVARNRGQYLLYATNDGTIKNGENILSYEQLVHNKKKYGYNEISHLALLGEAPPNPLGFYDMVTNYTEWMRDWYDADYYANSVVKNPSGPNSGTEKVMRSSSPQGGDNAFGGDGMNILRSKLIPTAMEGAEHIEPLDVSKSTTFRCVQY